MYRPANHTDVEIEVSKEINRGDRFTNNIDIESAVLKLEIDELSKSITVYKPRSTIGIIILKICATIVVLLISSPIIVTDLYFGFTDISCVNHKPDDLDISMKVYLLISGFADMVLVMIYIINICLLSSINDSCNIGLLTCIYYTLKVGLIFHIIWDIVGGIIFWNTVNRENICDKKVSTYIYVTLIIKFIRDIVIFSNIFSKKK